MGEQENIMTVEGAEPAAEEQKHDAGTEAAVEGDSPSENHGDNSSEDEGTGAEASATFEDGAGDGTPGGEGKAPVGAQHDLHILRHHPDQGKSGGVHGIIDGGAQAAQISPVQLLPPMF